MSIMRGMWKSCPRTLRCGGAMRNGSEKEKRQAALMAYISCKSWHRPLLAGVIVSLNVNCNGFGAISVFRKETENRGGRKYKIRVK